MVSSSTFIDYHSSIVSYHILSASGTPVFLLLESLQWHWDYLRVQCRLPGSAAVIFITHTKSSSGVRRHIHVCQDQTNLQCSGAGWISTDIPPNCMEKMGRHLPLIPGKFWKILERLSWGFLEWKSRCLYRLADFPLNLITLNWHILKLSLHSWNLCIIK